MSSKGNSGKATVVSIAVIVILAIVNGLLSLVARGWIVGSLTPPPHHLVEIDWHNRVLFTYIIFGVISGFLTVIFILLYKGGQPRNVKMHPKFWIYAFTATAINLIPVIIFTFVNGSADDEFFLTGFHGQHLLLLLSTPLLQLFFKWFLFRHNRGRTLVN